MEYPLEEQMFKNIVRVLKEHKYYTMFMKIVTYGTLSPYNYLVELKSSRKISSHFSNSNCMENLCNKMYQYINHEITIDEKDARKLQTVIAQYVNTLLHECVEPYLTKHINMEDLGRECFNRCCESIYGKGFKDETEGDSLDALRSRLIRDSLNYYNVSEIEQLPLDAVRKIQQILQSAEHQRQIDVGNNFVDYEIQFRPQNDNYDTQIDYPF